MRVWNARFGQRIGMYIPVYTSWVESGYSRGAFVAIVLFGALMRARPAAVGVQPPARLPGAERQRGDGSRDHDPRSVRASAPAAARIRT
ncbi:protein of unknown function [Cupriavidus taiwanensis]|nr:protein of unknown function [Cupriavidus taiwanensis]